MNGLYEPPFLPMQISSTTPFKSEIKKNESQTMSFKKKAKAPQIFNSLTKLPLKKANSVNQIFFGLVEEKPKEFIIIDDDENHKNSLFETKSISNKRSLGSQNNSPKAQSEEDCVILDKKEINVSFVSKKIKKQRFLDFKNKETFFFDSATDEDDNHANNSKFLDFRRVKRRTLFKERKTVENLKKILNEISQSHNLKLSDETLKTIFSEIDSNLTKKFDKKSNTIQIIDETDTDEDELQQQILKQSTLPIVQKDLGIRLGGKYQCKLPKFAPGNSKEIMRILEKHKVWECGKIQGEEFEEIKKLVESILKINSINEEFLCELVEKNNYKIQDTTKYCFENQKTLQARFVEKYAAESRRTRKSLYSKFS